MLSRLRFYAYGKACLKLVKLFDDILKGMFEIVYNSQKFCWLAISNTNTVDFADSKPENKTFSSKSKRI